MKGSSYIPSLYTNVNNTPVFKNRSTLPNLHTQSTFKSLLVQPANNSTIINNNSNNLINSNNNTNGTKVYFRPQDLNSPNRLVQIQQINDNKTSLNLDSFKHHLHSSQPQPQQHQQQQSNHHHHYQQHHSQPNHNNEVYAISKISPVHQSVPQLMANGSASTPIIVNKSMPAGKKLSLNVLTDERNQSSPIKDNTSLPPPIPLPVSRQQNIDLNKPVVNSNNNNNKILPTSTVTTTTCNNYIATKTTSSISTTTLTTTENFNSIKQRTPSPGFLSEKNNIITQVESPTPILISNASQKSKSWSLLNNNSNNNCTNSYNNNNNNKIGVEQENKNLISDRTPSSENRPQSSLTNQWKSTATASTLISSPVSSDSNLNKASKHDSVEELNKFSTNQIITIRPTSSSTGKLNDANYNLISSGKLVDAVKAATTINSNNSVEDGLGLVTNNLMPNLIKKSVNSNKTTSRKQTHVNLGFIEDDDNAQFILNENNRVLHQQRHQQQQQQQHQQHQQHQQQQNRKVNKNSLEDTISSSFSSSSQSSYANENNNYINSNITTTTTTNNNNNNPYINNVNSINNSKATNPNSLNSKATRPDESLNNLVSTESKREYSRPASNNNMASNLVSKSSSQTTDSNLNNIFNRNRNSTTTATTEQAVTERPPGRLNYYDSDTMSEGFMANAHRNLNNKKTFNNRELSKP